MFSLVSGVYESYFAPSQLNLLVVGASGAGKTALLERLKVTQFTKNKKASADDGTPDDVPQSFLPLRMRHASAAPKPPKQSKKHPTPKKKKSPSSNNNKKRTWACPAPSKYAKEESSDDDDDDDINESETTLDAMVPPPPEPNGLTQESSREISLEDVSLRDSERQPPPTTSSPEQDDKEDEEDEDMQHDLKSKMRMLPLHKIRPTIGMNLGKVEMCGAKCHVWDLGGKMHDLWSRYYQDCDAVVFVWKIVDDANPPMDQKNEDDDSDDDVPLVTAAQQLSLLEQVRDSIADDIPVLIWGHWFPQQQQTQQPKKDPAFQYNRAFATDAVLPHYHNPLMSVYFGSAKSGAGVRTAMEWLIPTAVRQKKFRDKSAAQNETA
ncbi:ribosylation factor-related protein 1 [Seminavis robusta]|uniref:Ribosylation factor-related protein 1 n=1 Tax=Seminavis robusta TaxID=568900 RepID=A0A9N8HND7_9STRA|nr:ribosylation factor-related protein 1 [Seminavis robusta]|eukprot:Sro985_g227990.1 ribosylation factor-related protein 1 (379) ;mRNA; f:10631-11971